MSILWTIIIGVISGVIAKFSMPGDNEPSGFILTSILGIVGAFVATYLGQALGWYRPGEGAGLIGAVVGAIIVLFVYHLVAGRSRAGCPFALRWEDPRGPPSQIRNRIQAETARARRNMAGRSSRSIRRNAADRL